jgi:deazaflavin-dependent oxidoreductase (nitroreductase family)
MKLLEGLRSAWLVVLKHTLNPLTRRLARSRFGPFSLVRHVGRRSGKPYETPIIMSRVPGGFVIELTYGPDVDWHKNVLAAGGCTVVWRGREYAVDAIEPLDSEAGRAAFPPLPRLILRLLGRSHFEKWTIKQ